MIKDSYGNSVKIPAGFKIASDSGNNVTEGVVIEDVEAGNNYTKGNQYVWVPVGNVRTNTSGSTKTITLGRYDFESNVAGDLKQSADDYTNVVTINEYFQELITTDYNNNSKNLGDFIKKSKEAGGYYIGRFEGGRIDENLSIFNIKKDQTVLNAWGQTTELAKNIYNNINFESDLVNSYAWDTAIIFIQTFSGDSDYSQQGSFQTTLTTTGNAHDSNNNYDVRCNIYDMAGNVYEWSTETSIFSHYNCVTRGDCYYGGRTAGTRDSEDGGNGFASVGFRSILYL